MDAGNYVAFGLVDTDGPPVEDEPWSGIRSSVYRLAREIFSLDVRLAGRGLTLTGSVTSEKVKARLEAIFRRVADHVCNEVEVTAPFECASLVTDRNASTVSTESLSRFPSVTLDGEARPNEAFRFEVDLAPTPDEATKGGAVELKDLPAGWTEVRVDVEVFCDAILFQNSSDRLGVVMVLPDGSSRPAAFRCLIKPDATVGDTYKMTVLFEQEGRPAGSAVRQIRIVQGPDAGGKRKETAVPPTQRGVQLVRDVQRPRLTVRIIEGSRPGVLQWSLGTPLGRVPFKTLCWSEETSLKADTSDFTRDLLGRCPNLKPGRAHVSVMRGIGERIWKSTPTCFRDLYAELRGLHGPRFPIQIVTNDPHVPWEIMHPDAEAGFPDADHLFMTHPIARWFASAEGGMRNGFPKGRIVTFVPDYPDGKALPAALEEGRRLVSEYGAERREATCDGFMGFLGRSEPGAPVSVLHFAGHANPPQEGLSAGEDGLRMIDGWISDMEVHGGVVLGMEDGTFVVLNACSAGVANHTLGVVGGWPASLASRGFGGILAPIWAIQDECASSIVLDYVAALAKGKTLGETMLDARVCYRNVSATPYAYLCHGDVMARLS
ncbi:hypothetical protein [Methylorubrum aminovorans]